jgi:hypothetical protein
MKLVEKGNPETTLPMKYAIASKIHLYPLQNMGMQNFALS